MNWTKEARDMGTDPASGAMIVRLSGSSIRTENIYCESPRATPDGRRLATLRYIDAITTPGKWLICHDAVHCAHLPETPDGELMLFPTDGKTLPRRVPMREHILYHISSSRCGRYLVGEGLEGGLDGPSPLVVVNPFTGKHRVLVQDCHCSLAGDCGRQAKPYFTATNRHVIYTADPDGIVNVFSAEVPKGFLESLG